MPRFVGPETDYTTTSSEGQNVNRAESTRTSTRGITRDGVTWLSYLGLGYLLYIESSLGPAMPSMRAEFGMSYTVASLHFTAIAGGAVVAAWSGDKFARRLGRRRTFWLGWIGVTLGAGAIVGSPFVIGTIFGALMLGVLGALLAIVVQAGLADHHGDARAIAMSELNLSATLGAILSGTAIGAMGALGLSWRVSVIAAIVIASASAWMLRHARFPKAVPPASGRRGGRHPLPRVFWLLCVLAMLSAGAEWSIAYWGAEFMHEHAGLSSSRAAGALTVFFVAMAAGRVAGSRLAAKFDSRQILLWTSVLAAFGFPVFWLTREPVITITGLALLGLGIANVYPAIASIATGLLPGRTDVVISRLMFTGSMSVLAAPFVLGVLGDLFGIRWAFMVMAPLLVGMLVIVVKLRTADVSPRIA